MSDDRSLPHIGAFQEVAGQELASYVESINFYKAKASRAEKIVALIGDATHAYILKNPSFPQILLDVRDTCTGHLLAEVEIAKERTSTIRKKTN